MSMGSTSLPPPTADELARWAAIKDRCTCTACGDSNLFLEIHHLLSAGGLRLGHRFTVGLCQHCHPQVKLRTFKKHYPDAWLLSKQDQAIGWPAVELPATRTRTRSRCTASTKQVRRPPGGFAP